MNVLDYCRAMASYCRQRTQFDGEDPTFWLDEAAHWERLLREHERPFDEIPYLECPRAEADCLSCIGPCEAVLA